MKGLRAKELNDAEIIRLMADGVRELGVTLPADSPRLFVKYLRELKAWNNKINLTAITDDREIVIRHFLDSLSVHAIIKGYGCRSLIDIGSGAGFPGIPLKIASRELDLLLMDSVEKKVHFMRHIIRILSLGSGITAVKARADDGDAIQNYGDRFDAAISRAFSSLDGFIKAAYPYVHAGGLFIAIKGPAGIDEAASELFSSKGLSEPAFHEVSVPFTDRKNTVIVVRKSR